MDSGRRSGHRQLSSATPASTLPIAAPPSTLTLHLPPFLLQLLRLESLRQLPRLALSKMAGAQASCLMGLWGEIHRCWAAFDDEVLIWNYDEDVPEGGDPLDYRCVTPSVCAQFARVCRGCCAGGSAERSSPASHHLASLCCLHSFSFAAASSVAWASPSWR